MWTIDGIRVVIEKVEPIKSVVSAELHNIGSMETTIHHYGATSTKYKFAGRVVGFDTVNAIENIVASGNTVVISGNKGFYKNVYLKSFDYNWINTVAQTFDPTHHCEDPVFKFSIEAIEQ